MDDKKKQLLNKLKALAERGVGGEKETAQRKLQELMEKYEIDEMIYQMTRKENINLNIRMSLKRN